jgi:uncharacterized phiE125 gp8 family phage protein
MTMVLTEGPLAEPVSLAELKVQTRVDGSEEDILLSSLIVAARLYVEQTFGLALINQNWSYFLDGWPQDLEFHPPLRPIQTVSALRVYDSNGAATTVGASDYAASVSQKSIRVMRRPGAIWPAPGRSADGVEIAFTAGFGAEGSKIPEPIRRAILMLAAWWFEDREPVPTQASLSAPPAILALLGPYREFRL